MVNCLMWDFETTPLECIADGITAQGSIYPNYTRFYIFALNQQKVWLLLFERTTKKKPTKSQTLIVYTYHNLTRFFKLKNIKLVKFLYVLFGFNFKILEFIFHLLFGHLCILYTTIQS